MKTWLIEMSCDGHKYTHGVMTCSEETVKKYCAFLAQQSEYEAYCNDDDYKGVIYADIRFFKRAWNSRYL